MLKQNLILFLALLLIVPSQTFAQHSLSEIVNSLNEVIKPIESLRADTSFADINFLKETLKDRELIALGEVTHGSAEIFDYKDRLVRFLVANLGYKSIAFESDFIAIEQIDNYINGKADSIVHLPGTAVVLSNYSMIKWLRKYNSGLKDPDKVHMYGMELRNYSNIFKKLLAEIPGLEKVDRELMEAYIAKPFTGKITKEELQGTKSMIAKLQTIQLSDINRHYIEMLSQTISYKGKSSIRDSYMAKNITWLKDRAKDKKIIIWAHNGHVGKTSIYNYTNIGTQLVELYSSKYYVIGTDFNSGEVNVNVRIAKNKRLLGFQPYYYRGAQSGKWYEYYFNQCKYKNFILEISSASKIPTLDQFLKHPFIMKTIGALSSPEGTKLSIAKNFDLLIYIDKTKSI